MMDTRVWTISADVVVKLKTVGHRGWRPYQDRFYRRRTACDTCPRNAPDRPHRARGWTAGELDRGCRCKRKTSNGAAPGCLRRTAFFITYHTPCAVHLLRRKHRRTPVVGPILSRRARLEPVYCFHLDRQPTTAQVRIAPPSAPGGCSGTSPVSGDHLAAERS